MSVNSRSRSARSRISSRFFRWRDVSRQLTKPFLRSQFSVAGAPGMSGTGSERSIFAQITYIRLTSARLTPRPCSRSSMPGRPHRSVRRPRDSRVNEISCIAASNLIRRKPSRKESRMTPSQSRMTALRNIPPSFQKNRRGYSHGSGRDKKNQESAHATSLRYNRPMALDKYTAVWVSHSSMGDFLKCPRAYYLHNVYKDPKMRRKIALVNSPLSLGHAVHATLESLKTLPVDGRLARDLFEDFEAEWESVAGKRGGFTRDAEEGEHKARGRAMIERVIRNPGPLAKKTVRLPAVHNDMPHNIVLSEGDNIILCGLIDWLEYVEADESIP